MIIIITNVFSFSNIIAIHVNVAVYASIMMIVVANDFSSSNIIAINVNETVFALIMIIIVGNVFSYIIAIGLSGDGVPWMNLADSMRWQDSINKVVSQEREK